jgi:hypothetical protein
MNIKRAKTLNWGFPVILDVEIISYSENHTEQLNTLCVEWSCLMLKQMGHIVDTLSFKEFRKGTMSSITAITLTITGLASAHLVALSSSNVL